MTSKLGIHLIPAHGRPGDVELVRRLVPGAVKLLNPDAQKLADLYAAAPRALFVLRDHPRSEQHEDMARDPVATGPRHAQEAWADWQRWSLRGVTLPPLAQCLWLGMNEPHVWDALAQTVQYTVAFLDGLAVLGLRGGALNLSVGWPANSGPGTAPDWRPYEPVRLALGRGDHMLVLHEYWGHEGPQKNRVWWAERYQWCNWPVPILIGECGLDEYVANGAVEAHRRGWQGWLTAEQYMAQLAAYDAMLQADNRIVAGLVFTTDYGSRDWQSFDTEPLHGLWPDRETNHRETGNKETGNGEQQDRSVDEASVVPVSRFPFPVSRVATTCAGVNVRVQPGLRAAVVRVLPAATAVGLAAEAPVQMDGCQWYAITSPVVGWVAEVAPNGVRLLEIYGADDAPLAVVPDNGVPQTDSFQRALAFVLRWEGGYVHDANDPGGETNMGISKAAHPEEDIQNMTVARATAIYYQTYWLASGADKLAWPLALAHMDAAVNCGVGQAMKFLQTGGVLSFAAYNARRLTFYTELGLFARFGVAWVRRVADLLIEGGEGA